MKILIINGSPRVDGNCDFLIKELTGVFTGLGAETEVIRVGGKDIRGCSACGYCYENGKCVFNDLVNETAQKFDKADGLIVVSPVYYASPNGSVLAFLDRLFYSSHFDKKMKVGAAFAVARRGGTTATYDALNKYFTISGMPVVSGDYWNISFGRAKGEIEGDKEGLRNAREVAKRTVFLIKAIADAKDKYPELLVSEPRVMTGFIK